MIGFSARFVCALLAFRQAKSDLDSRKVKLAKLRGTPGLKVGPTAAVACASAGM
jgi:hypothetical protein